MHYRLYFLDNENAIADAADAECAIDEQAVVAAQEKTDGRRIEIWQRTRKVEVLTSAEPAIGG
jgi:hypothetical protein